MTQLTINIEDKSIVPHLKKILGAIEGVSIVKSSTKKKCGLDEALDDVKACRDLPVDTGTHSDLFG